MVDVSHDRDDGRARFEPALVDLLLGLLLLVLDPDDLGLVAELGREHVSASSESDCEAVAISPSEISCFTISPTERSVLSATSCAVEPCTSFSVGRAGPASTSERRRARAGSASGVDGSGTGRDGPPAALDVSGSAAASSGVFGSGSSTASLILASGTALPPEARSRRLPDRDRRHAVRPSIPISFSDASSSLLAIPSSLASS